MSAQGENYGHCGHSGESGRAGESGMATALADLAMWYVRERGQRGEIRAGSVRTIRHTLNSLLDVVGWERPASKLRKTHIEKWLGRKGLNPSTRRSQLSIVRMFCRWMVVEGHIMRDPTAGIATPRQPRYLPRGFKGEQVRAVLDACPGPRERLAVLLMAQEALRCCEVVGLEVGDIDTDERLLLVRCGKGGHQRALPVSSETWEAIGVYLRERPAHAGPLIRACRGNQGISAKYLSHLVAALIDAAGVDGSAHALRHTAATDMLRAGAHIRDVQRALGHESIATTQRYLPWLVRDLRSAMGGRHYGQPHVERNEDVG